MKLVSCVGWVPRGRAAAVPHKVKLDAEELRALMSGGGEEATVESSDVGGEEDEEEPQSGEGDAEHSAATCRSTGGLRGSAADEYAQEDKSTSKLSRKRKAIENGDTRDNADNGSDSDDEDEEQTGDTKATALTGVAMFASAVDDPYIEDHHDSSDDDEDFKIGADDNQIVAGKIIKSEYNLVVYVYNSSSHDLYVHHDYALDAPPLCLSTIGFDPDASKGYKGNLCAVGTMSHVIDIWDLDIVNGVEPIASFGAAPSQSKKKKRRKKESSSSAGASSSSSQPAGHSDSVLSLEWNASMDHVLASGSADHTVVLWDIETGDAANVAKHHSDKVQSLRWHPSEATTLLSAGCDGQLVITDCNSMQIAQKWHIKGAEVECAIWHCANEHVCIASTDAGNIHLFDRRHPSRVLHVQHEAHHDGAASSVAMHDKWPDMLLSTGEGDQMVKVWSYNHTDAAQPLEMIYAHEANLDVTYCSFLQWIMASASEKYRDYGSVHGVSMCVDAPTPCVALCGTAGDYMSVFRLNTQPAVAEHFSLNT